MKGQTKRLIRTKEWLKTVKPGLSNIELVRLYKKAFSLVKFVAVDDLKKLGFKFDSDYYDELKKNYEIKKERKRQKKKQKEIEIDDDIIEYDDGYFYIVGYTSGGAPYGCFVKNDENENESEDDTGDIF